MAPAPPFALRLRNCPTARHLLSLTPMLLKMPNIIRPAAAVLVPLAASLCISCQKQEATSYSREDIEMEMLIKDYLEATWTSAVSDVTVTADKVVVSGHYSGNGEFYVAEIPPYMDLLRLDEPLSAVRPDKAAFSFETERYVETEGGIVYDRLLSKWAVFEEGRDGGVLASDARYADSVPAISSPEPVPLRGKKGLGGIFMNEYMTDFDELSAGSATLNMFVTQFTYLSPGEGRIAHEYGGRTYWFDENFIRNNLDSVLEEAGRRDMCVAAILLVQNESAAMDKELARLLTDPGYTGGGTLIMPNMTSPESVNCFAAIVDFLVSRYTREDGRYGRVSHWIVLNEVDGASSWANMGVRPQYYCTDYYIKVLRLVNNILRQYDGNAETFASFTHSWTLAALDYPAKEMIETIDAMGKKEGDYRWALAVHSYPWDLLNPRCWECPYSTPSMDAQCVSFRNLEVLDKWIRMPEHRYGGTVKRSVWLSEAGLNSRSYSAADLEEQAAGTAYAWKKVEALEGIDAWQWHNWFDNMGDGTGAMLGLRKFREEYGGEAKPAWQVFKAAGTEDEDSCFGAYLEYLGLESWDEIMYDEEDIG